MRTETKRRMIFWPIAIIAIFLLVPLISLVMYTLPRTIESGITPEKLNLPHDDVMFRSTDGTPLRGWFIPTATGAQEQAPTLIFLHGYPAEKGNILPFARSFNDDYNLFLFDMRALGDSGGTFSTLGMRETRDLKAAVSYVSHRTDGPIGVWGLSMGGATALMTAAEEPAIDAVVVDSSYATMGSMTQHIFPVPIIDHAFGTVLNVWGWLFFGVHPDNVSPKDALRDLTVPVLLIHSTGDSVVPVSEARQLKAIADKKENARMRILPAGSHGSINRATRQEIHDFFDRVLLK